MSEDDWINDTHTTNLVIKESPDERRKSYFSLSSADECTRRKWTQLLVCSAHEFVRSSLSMRRFYLINGHFNRKLKD